MRAVTRSIRNPDSAPGDWYVDTACIDCGASRHVAPNLIIERNGKGEAKIMTVKDNKIHIAHILVGIDNGLRVEVISGLTESDATILRPDESVAEGTKVETELDDESKSMHFGEH